MYPKFPKPIRKKKTKNNIVRKVKDFINYDIPEKVLQLQCEEYLDLLGIKAIRLPDALFRCLYGQGNSVKKRDAARISKYLKGQPDLTILLSNGNFICVELKRKGGQLSQGQKKWSSGYISEFYHVIDDFDDFKKLVDKYRFTE